MAVQVLSGTGELYHGGYVGESSGGNKVCVILDTSGNSEAYEALDGTPSQIGSSQTSATMFGGGAGSVCGLSAEMDSGNVVHVVASPQTPGTRGVSYVTISNVDSSPAWGTWEQAAAFDQNPASGVLQQSVDIGIDQNDIPHVVYCDRHKVHGTSYQGIFYTNRIGGSWATPVAVDGSAESHSRSPRIIVVDNNTAYATWINTSGNDFYLNSRTSGSWNTASLVYNGTTTSINSYRAGIAYDGTEYWGIFGESSAGLFNIREYGTTSGGADTTFNANNTLSVDGGIGGIWANATSGDRHVVYAPNTDSDLHVISDTGSGWGDSGSLYTGTLVHIVSGYQYRNLNNTTSIDIIWEDSSGNIYWDEFSLVSGFTQSVSGALTFSGTVSTIKRYQRSLSGALTFAGDVVKKTSKSFAGTLSTAGTLSKKMFEALSGAISFSGDVATQSRFTKALSGAISFSGDLTKKTLKALSGSFTSSGDLVKKTFKIFSGSITPAGSISKKIFESLAGTVTFAGDLATQSRFTKALAGSITFAGDLTKKTLKALAGSITPAGTVSTLRTAFQSLSGSITPTGTVSTIRKQFKALAGAITFAGDLAAVKVGTIFNQSVAGAITFSGDLTKKTSKTIAGTITFAGDIAKKTSKILSGVFTSSGDLAKKTLKTLSGSLSTSGILTPLKLGSHYFQSVAGSLTFSGTVSTAKTMFQTLAGSLSFAGNLSKRTSKTVYGIITMSGEISKKTSRILIGALTFSGSLSKKISKTLSGALTFIGSVSGLLNPLTDALKLTVNFGNRTFGSVLKKRSFVVNVGKSLKRSFTLHFKDKDQEL